MGFTLNPVEAFVNSLKAKFASALSKKGVTLAQLEADVKEFETAAAPFIQKFAPDLAQLNTVLYGGTLTPAEITSFQAVLTKGAAIAKEVEEVAQVVQSLSGK
jgi:hypothetical protein